MKKLVISLSILVVIILVLIIFFSIPYSKTKTKFSNLVKEGKEKSLKQEGVFTMEDIADLPEPVQNYFINCGFIGKNKMTYIKAEYKNVDFAMDRKKKLKIDYTQYNFVDPKSRVAFIDAKMFGIPFQGLDIYAEHKGEMLGVLAKTFTLFDEKGKDMDEGELVTFLAEALIIPTVAIQDYINWEAIDEYHAKATLTDGDLSVTGIFEFNRNFEMISFVTDERLEASSGTKVRWTAKCDNYKEKNGIKYPSVFQGIWNFDDGDFMYFDGKDIEIEYYN